MRRCVVVVVLCLSALALAAPAGADDARGPEVVPGSFVVAFEPGVEPAAKVAALERARGFSARHRFETVLPGFSARLSPGQVRALRADPDVAFVTPDVRVRAAGPLSAGDSIPIGVRRVEAATTTTVRAASGVSVAVIDTGVDLDHPDLDVRHGVNCLSAAPADDDNGHGTHVAGTIAARNDGAGVTGVAPGTRLWAVKVLDASGNGSFSSIICGLDWVTRTRTDADTGNDVAVANMSLGGGGYSVATCATTTDALHKAVCRATAAGVTVVAAAGNSGWDFDYATSPDVPAAYPEVLTVSAMTDSDGQGGALGGAPACDSRQSDDRYTTFSNYAATAAGAAHLVAAPGSCVQSTWPGGGYKTISGTSMAAPHVAGVVALCLDEGGVAGPCAGASAADVVSLVRSAAAERTTADAGYGFAGDPVRPVSGRAYGHLAWTRPAPVPSGPDQTAPTITSTSPADGATGVSSSTQVSVTFSEEMDREAAVSAFSLDGGAGAVAGSTSWSGSTLVFRPSSALAAGTVHRLTVGTGAKDAAGNPLAAPFEATFTTAPASVKVAPSAVVIQNGKVASGGVSSLSANDGAMLQVSSTTKSPYRVAWYGRIYSVPTEVSALTATLSGKHGRTCRQTLSAWRWTTSSWVALDSRDVGTSEVAVTAAVGGTLADYVSGSSGPGEVRLRMFCETRSGRFTSVTDLLSLAYAPL